MRFTFFILISCIAINSISLNAKEIYVSKNGNDNNIGTIIHPYLTITRAITNSKAGDTIFIKKGIYREMLKLITSGTKENPIVIQPYQNEKVIVSALEIVNKWFLYKDKVYKANVDWDLGQENYVFNGIVPMDLARWPNNIDGNRFTTDAVQNTTGSDKETAINAEIIYTEGIPNYNWANGGSVFFYCTKAGWTTWSSYIKSNTQNSITFDLDKNPDWIRTFHSPKDKGDFFLQGVREALDYQNEWYYDSETKELFVQLPNGIKPGDDKIQMRKRKYAIDFNHQSHIRIQNIAVVGGEIKMNGSYNSLYSISSFYGNNTLGVVQGFLSGAKSIYLSGSNNSIEKCEIAFGAGTGVLDDGEANKLLNNYIHDFNYLGMYDSPINSRGGKNSVYKNNTINTSGRDCIQLFNRNVEVAYNDVSNSNLIADDCGLIYSVNGPHYSEIHHNWFHDAFSAREDKHKAAGIYLDNNASEFVVHHNVVWDVQWSAIHMNKDTKNIIIFNNTLWNNEAVMGSWHPEGTQFTNVKVYNNLGSNDFWEPQSDAQNNLSFSKSEHPFIDVLRNDFRLQKNTLPIDFGIELENLKYAGKSPDVGAYELGEEWKAGVDWDIEKGPTVHGDYDFMNSLFKNK